MGDFVLSVSCNTVSFDLFAVHKFVTFSIGNYLSVASCFFATVLKFSRPRTYTLVWVHSSALLLVWMEIYLLFFSTDFILWKLFFNCVIIDTISVHQRSQIFELISMFEFIPVDKDIDLRTLIVSLTTIMLSFCCSIPLLYFASFSNNAQYRCKSSLFSAFIAWLSAYLKLFMLCPLTLISEYSSMFSIFVSLLKRLKISS